MSNVDEMDVVEFAQNFMQRTNHPGFKIVVNDCIQEIEQLRAEVERLTSELMAVENYQEELRALSAKVAELEKTGPFPRNGEVI